MKSLIDYVIEHEKADIAEYYDKYIKPLDKRFEDSSLVLNRTAICPLHDDTDPSLGLINHRHKKGVRIYHCFGCGLSGTIVRLHQLVEFKFNKRNLTDKESAEDLCRLLGIDLSKVELADDSRTESSYVKKLRAVKNFTEVYSIRDYERDLLSARKSSNLDEMIRRVNSANVKMIATRKQLYS